ncbi:MAG: hypothetical protein ACO23G_12780 [Limnohabitans sp.]
MVSVGGVGGVRHLLPFEAQLCEQLGITAEEYLYFEQLSQAYNGKRPEGYELVPDVRNDPISIIVAIVVGVAATVAAAALAPKPKAPQLQQQTQVAPTQQQEAAPQLQTANISGSTRFTANAGFDSVQQLASLGETIPLVFANKQGEVGGVRVKTLLLWSQLLSEQISQELVALMLLSAGTLAKRPEFAGYSIGDQTLKNYTHAKLALYYRENGGRIQNTDRYSEGELPEHEDRGSGWQDVFTCYDDVDKRFEPWFCGTRSPSTQTQFGCFRPMVNATPYRLQYELVLIPRAEGTDGRLQSEAQTKKNKVNRDYATRAAFTAKTDSTLTYTVTGGQEDPNAYAPWGTDDVNAAVEDRRIISDDEINLSGLYMAGSMQVTCTKTSSNEVWELNNEKTYTFKILEPGNVSIFTDPAALNDGNVAPNPAYGYVLQRLAVATVANNRACDVTELGIKSTVWKRINGFPNVNSQPDDGTISYYESKNGSISLGSINRYVRRISFFKLQVRPLGTADDAWLTLEDGRLFGVEGNTPSPKYSYIRINHEKRGQYEFRLVPVPGAEIVANWLNKSAYFLGGGARASFEKDGYLVTFNGYLKDLVGSTTTNPDWVVGRVPEAPKGIIKTISPGNNGSSGLVKPTYTYTTTRREERTECRWNAGSGMNYGGCNGWIEWKHYASGHPANSHTTFWDCQAVGGAGGSDGGWNVGGYGKGAHRQTWKQYVNNPGPYIPTIWEGYEVCRTLYRDVTETHTAYENPTATTVYSVPDGSGSGATIRVLRYSNGYREFELVEGGLGYKSFDTISITDAGYTQTFTITTDGTDYTKNTLNLHDAVIDIYKYDAESSSHQDGPEHTVVYVNEQLKQDSPGPQYDNLALIGLRLSSSKEWSSFAQLSAYVQQGVVVERLIDDNGNPTTTLQGPTNNFAEIAYAVLTNEEWGAGKFIGKEAVDRERMTIAARYCHANGFTWDGVLGSAVNLRNFIYENAGYALLDFTILGGRFSLAPTCTYDASTFKIDPNKAVPIKALFTDGNIRDLKVTWLSPEERRLFKAVVKYRKEQLNGFPEEKLVSIRLNDAEGGTDLDPEENFDLTAFCTQRDHALKFAKMALRLRQLVDHSVSFQTTPASALNLAPGEHFRLVSECTHTSRFANGVITAEGMIVSAEPLADGPYEVIYWVPGSTEVLESTMTVAGGVCQEVSLRGTVYTIANTTTSNRVYKVETLSIGEEGFIEITASHEPVFDGGAMATLDWNDSYFVIEES